MPQNQKYTTIKELSERISAKAIDMEQGRCDLAEMDILLKELRELEERVIVIRFKAMEKLRAPRKKPKSILAVNEPQLAPELPLDLPKTVEEPLMELPVAEIQPKVQPEPEPEEHPIEASETESKSEEESQMDEIPENQISLIDSIEEISKEASINERMQRKTKKTLAQSLEGKPVASVMKAMNLNMKMGMIKALFAGDETQFKTVLGAIDGSNSLEEAEGIYADAVSEELRANEAMAQKLEGLIKRRFA